MQIQTITTDNLADCANMQSDVLIIMPFTDVVMAKRAALHMAQRAGVEGHVLLVEDLHAWGFVRIVNHVFKITSCRYFGYVAQDAFAGRQWLTLALDALRQPGKSLFGFNDGKWHGAFASFGLVERQWASQNYPEGDLFQSGYRKHYADVELSLLAMSQGRYIYDPRSVLVEVDWAKDSTPVDPQDRAHYRTRVACGFDGRVTRPELLNLVT